MNGLSTTSATAARRIIGQRGSEEGTEVEVMGGS
jgi:hypothetical protein